MKFLDLEVIEFIGALRIQFVEENVGLEFEISQMEIKFIHGLLKQWQLCKQLLKPFEIDHQLIL